MRGQGRSVTADRKDAGIFKINHSRSRSRLEKVWREKRRHRAEPGETNKSRIHILKPEVNKPKIKSQYLFLLV